jgi:hypothetical protein
MSRTPANQSGLSPNLDTEVGRMVIDQGLATPTELDFCREQQKQSSDPNQRSLADLLVANGWEVLEVKPRFLPLTVKSRLPVSQWLIALYLRMPFKPMGKQMLLRARPVRP